MKPAEKFITALKRGIPDRVPIFEFPFSQKLQEELIGYRTELYDGVAIAKVSQELGLDAIPVFMGGYCGFDFFGSEDDTFTDDWGSTKGLLLSPGHLGKHFLRPYGKLVRGLKELGLPVIMHNDGNIRERLEELVDTGIDACHPVEKMAGMDLARVKQKYGQRICPIGNVNNKTVLVSGNAEEVKAETISCLKAGSSDGGYIISSDNSIHDDIPIENVNTFIRTAKESGVYSGRELRS